MIELEPFCVLRGSGLADRIKARLLPQLHRVVYLVLALSQDPKYHWIGRRPSRPLYQVAKDVEFEPLDHNKAIILTVHDLLESLEHRGSVSIECFEKLVVPRRST